MLRGEELGASEGLFEDELWAMRWVGKKEWEIYLDRMLVMKVVPKRRLMEELDWN